jgi:hypothetical protein
VLNRGNPLMDPLVFLIVDNLRFHLRHRGHLLGLTGGIEAGCPGSRSAGTMPAILTGVLKATVRNLQAKTPAPG